MPGMPFLTDISFPIRGPIEKLPMVAMFGLSCAVQLNVAASDAPSRDQSRAWVGRVWSRANGATISVPACHRKKRSFAPVQTRPTKTADVGRAGFRNNARGRAGLDPRMGHRSACLRVIERNDRSRGSRPALPKPRTWFARGFATTHEVVGLDPRDRTRAYHEPWLWE